MGAEERIVIGVDPGLKGALACIGSKGILVEPLHFNKGSRHSLLDIVKMDVFIGKCADLIGTPGLVAVEDVHSMPRDSKKGAFTFGWGTGSVVTYFLARGFEVGFFSPKEWQDGLLKELKYDIKEEATIELTKREINKLASLTYVRTHYPNISLKPTPRSKLDNDGLSDALCIATYARMKN